MSVEQAVRLGQADWLNAFALALSMGWRPPFLCFLLILFAGPASKSTFRNY